MCTNTLDQRRLNTSGAPTGLRRKIGINFVSCDDNIYTYVIVNASFEAKTRDFFSSNVSLANWGSCKTSILYLETRFVMMAIPSVSKNLPGVDTSDREREREIYLRPIQARGPSRVYRYRYTVWTKEKYEKVLLTGTKGDKSVSGAVRFQETTGSEFFGILPVASWNIESKIAHWLKKTLCVRL